MKASPVEMWWSKGGAEADFSEVGATFDLFLSAVAHIDTFGCCMVLWRVVTYIGDNPSKHRFLC